MPNLEEIKRQIKSLGHTGLSFAGKEIKCLPEILKENEKIEKIITGFYNYEEGVLVATNERVIYVNKTLFKLVIEEILYGEIKSLQCITEAKHKQVLTITTFDKKYEFFSIPNYGAEFIDYISSKTSKNISKNEVDTSLSNQISADSMSSGTPDEKALLVLREKSVITCEEYNELIGSIGNLTIKAYEQYKSILNMVSRFKTNLDENEIEIMIRQMKIIIEFFTYKMIKENGNPTRKKIDLVNTLLEQQCTMAELEETYSTMDNETNNAIVGQTPLLITLCDHADDVYKVLASIETPYAVQGYKAFRNICICALAIDGNISDAGIEFFKNYFAMIECDIFSKTKDESNRSTEKAVSDRKNEQNPVSLEDLLAELNQLVGLNRVKADVNEVINLLKVRQFRLQHGLPTAPVSSHLVFTGNPGTGKTTVARLLSQIYKALGLISKGHLVEVDRSGLVAGYVGQTALKVKDVVKEAMGGVLFIDEAYALVCDRGNEDFGNEAIDTLLKEMEDNRNDLVVIVAGYTNEMEEFLRSNPGLRSRFNKYINFDDYGPTELYEIFTKICNKLNYSLTSAAQERALILFEELPQLCGENFANARSVRNIFEQILSNQANRIVLISNPTKEDLSLIDIADFEDLQIS